MAPKLYMINASPPVRAVLLTAKALGIELEQETLNMLEGEHLKPEFLKMNPQHTVPTLEDDGFIIWDSHAIMGYLVNKFASSDALYPKDPQKRAVVDQRLHFDSGNLFPLVRAIARPILFLGEKSIPEDRKQEVIEAYKIVERFLDGKQWVASDKLSIADFSFGSTISTLNILVPISKSEFPKISTWLAKFESLPYYSANKEGLELFRGLIESKMQG